MNWADITIILAVVLFGVSGYFKGFIRQAWDLMAVVVAFVFSIKFYVSFSSYIVGQFSISPSFGKIISFLVLWVIIQFVLNLIFNFIYPVIPEPIRKSFINRTLGAIPGLLWGLIFVAIVLTLFITFPINSSYKDAVMNSVSGKYIVAKSAYLEKYVTNIFGGAINDTLTFVTVKPNSGETLDLGFKTTKVTVDANSEVKMLELVNKERTSRGLKPLVMDEKLREVARAHSKDMFARGYFAHNDPDGKDPFDRMKAAGINYLVAGENLALAPSVDLAHDGLMNSPGHRANILTAEYGKVGIGVIDGGPYGKMFSQEFTN
jgi:uncharacterized protein YkwD